MHFSQGVSPFLWFGGVGGFGGVWGLTSCSLFLDTEGSIFFWTDSSTSASVFVTGEGVLCSGSGGVPTKPNVNLQTKYQIACYCMISKNMYR